MKISKKLFIAILAIFGSQSPSFLFGHATTSPNSSEITLMDDLHSSLTSTEPTIIMGYMDHCPHCKALHKFFDTLPVKFNRINFATTNGQKLGLHKIIAEYSKGKFKIPGYPVILFIKNGVITDLQVGGNTQALEERIKKLSK